MRNRKTSSLARVSVRLPFQVNHYDSDCMQWIHDNHFIGGGPTARFNLRDSTARTLAQRNG